MMRYWTLEEVAYLRANYWAMGTVGIARQIDRARTAISQKAHEMGFKANSSIQRDAVLNKEDLSHFYALRDPFIIYWFGFLWADGTIAKKTNNIRLKIVKPDFDVIADRLKIMAKSWRIWEYDDGHPNHQIQSIAEIDHEGLWKFLVAHDYHIKSGTAPTKILEKIAPELRHYWWRGYFDGDGCFLFDGKTVRVSIVSCKDQDWSFAEALTKDAGISYRISRKIQKGCSCSSINMECEASVSKFMTFILQGEQFGLQRKYDKYYAYKGYKTHARPTKTSKYRGVSRSRGRWLMQFWSGGPTTKSFDNEELAAKAYDALALQYRGNKAVFNFPQ